MINGHQVHACVLLLSQKERAPWRVLHGLKAYFVFLHVGIPKLLRKSCSQVQRPFVAGKLYRCPTSCSRKILSRLFCLFLTITFIYCLFLAYTYSALNTDMLKPCQLTGALKFNFRVQIWHTTLYHCLATGRSTISSSYYCLLLKGFRTAYNNTAYFAKSQLLEWIPFPQGLN